MGTRKGQMQGMAGGMEGGSRVTYTIPTRGLLGAAHFPLHIWLCHMWKSPTVTKMQLLTIICVYGQFVVTGFEAQEALQFKYCIVCRTGEACVR